MAGLAAAVSRRAQAWARRRQGEDRGTVTLLSRRIYILPTGQGLAFAAMILLMLLGAMNYNNSVGLAATFALSAFALVVMHHCHRALSGLTVRLHHAPPVFAGQDACFVVQLHNTGAFRRHDIGVLHDDTLADCISLDPGESARVTVRVPTTRRGTVQLTRFSIRSRYPAALFEAFAWINTDLRGIVYPAPAAPGGAPPEHAGASGGRHETAAGDSDFAGLREYRTGDSPRHIAWKEFARSDALRTKQFAGADKAPLRFDWSDTHGDTEARLARLCRWIVDAAGAGRAFGLTLPGTSLAPARGPAHTHAALGALASFP